MEREPDIQISDYPNVVERVIALGLQTPSQIALLPRNFNNARNRDELVHESEAPTVRVLFRRAKIIETPIELSEEPIPQIGEHAFHEWIAPIIFFSYSALSQNPMLIDLAVGVIANYLTELFKGLSTHRDVRLEIVVGTSNGGYKKVHYQGPKEGLSEISEIVKRVNRDE